MAKDMHVKLSGRDVADLLDDEFEKRLRVVNAMQAVADNDWQEFVNDILRGAPDDWDNDDDQTSIAVAYVREMERRLDAADISRDRWVEE